MPEDLSFRSFVGFFRHDGFILETAQLLQFRGQHLTLIHALGALALVDFHHDLVDEIAEAFFVRVIVCQFQQADLAESTAEVNGIVRQVEKYQNVIIAATVMEVTLPRNMTEVLSKNPANSRIASVTQSARLA